ncbi:hypothetical protein ABIA99_002915 [Bradyrhizobium sp. LB12.1]|uniref:hypothetical protein n=1 Tax=Bradyrhizobium sp. LB12.1 TaxID=3156327 RepID=UPI003392D327
MAKSTVSNIRKKRPLGRPRVDAVPVMVRMPPNEMQGVDRWIEGRPPPKPSRPEAIRRLVEIGLGKSLSNPAMTSTGKVSAERAKELAAKTIDRIGDPAASAKENATRKRRLIKGPSEFREQRVDRGKGKA